MICASPWHGLYSGQAALLTPDSFAHPAKMAPALVFRIFDHLAELGLLKPDDTVLDPMAGTGLTGLAWAAKGGRSVLVELEPRFVGFIGENKAQLARTLGREVDIEVLQGDARHLSELLGERGLKAVTSPPYGDAVNSGKPGIDYAKAGRLDRLQESESRHNPMSTGEWAYGTTPGQIGALPDKPLKAVTSPPYGDTLGDWKNKDAAYPGQFYGDGFQNIGNLPESLEGKTKADWWRKKALEGCTETYIDAMRQVYAEVAKVADVLVVVTKNPTRNGRLRRLDLDTIALLEECGWRIHCHHHAILFTEVEQYEMMRWMHDTPAPKPSPEVTEFLSLLEDDEEAEAKRQSRQDVLDYFAEYDQWEKTGYWGPGGIVKRTMGRLSFFKRLSWQKGNAVARWEDVLVCVRGSQ